MEQERRFERFKIRTEAAKEILTDITISYDRSMKRLDGISRASDDQERIQEIISRAGEYALFDIGVSCNAIANKYSWSGKDNEELRLLMHKLYDYIPHVREALNARNQRQLEARPIVAGE